MRRFRSRWPASGALAVMILAIAALYDPAPAAAHCGEHADSCGPTELREAAGGWCADAADPFDYGTWWQPYDAWAVWCNFPVRCLPATCSAEVPCGIGRTCVAGACSCPPGTQAECASCALACKKPDQVLVPFALDARCWPWGIEDSVPCAGGWRNHGQYVNAVASLLNMALGDGLITGSQHDALMEGAGESSCGK